MNLSKLMEKIIQDESYSRDMAKKFKNLAIISGGVALGSLYFFDKNPTISMFGFLAGTGFTIVDITNYFKYNQYSNYLRERHPTYFNQN